MGFTCIAASCQRLPQAFLFIMYIKLPPLVMYSTPCCRVYAAPAFTVISDRCFPDLYHRRQSTNKPDCYSLHQFPPDVVIPALYHCSCLFHIPGLSLPLSLGLISSALCLIPLTLLFSLPFSCPDLSKFPCMLACCHRARGIWRDDQVKMMCFAASSFFFLTRRGCIILYPLQFRPRADAHWHQLLTVQGLLRCQLSIKNRH